LAVEVKSFRGKKNHGNSLTALLLGCAEGGSTTELQQMTMKLLSATAVGAIMLASTALAQDAGTTDRTCCSSPRRGRAGPAMLAQAMLAQAMPEPERP
jgi:hypothetical protein